MVDGNILFAFTAGQKQLPVTSSTKPDQIVVQTLS